MNDKLRSYINTLFQDAPQTKKTVELKEEMLQNLTDKYNDLVAAGQNEEAAYNIAVASVGDIGELIENLHNSLPQQQTHSNEELLQDKKRSALFVSVAVILYILCVIPVIILESSTGIVLMFVFVAIATGLIIYNNMTRLKYTKLDDTVVEEFREWKATNSNKHQAYKAISSALWSITVVIYIIISFSTMAWHITWVIFLIAAAIESVIKAGFELRK
ncbi:MAG: permease prefix domain 1-containing protein [Clostridia bacterium]